MEKIENWLKINGWSLITAETVNEIYQLLYKEQMKNHELKESMNSKERMKFINSLFSVDFEAKRNGFNSELQEEFGKVKDYIED